MLLAFTFLGAAALLTWRLKQNQANFYNEHKSMLWITTFLLTAPLLVRSIFDFFNRIDTWDQFWANKVVLYNSLFFIVVDLVPIIC